MHSCLMLVVSVVVLKIVVHMSGIGELVLLRLNWMAILPW